MTFLSWIVVFFSFTKSNRIEVSKYYCCLKRLPWRTGLLFIEISWLCFLVVLSSSQQFKPSYPKVSFLFFFSCFLNYLILTYLITVFLQIRFTFKILSFLSSFNHLLIYKSYGQECLFMVIIVAVVVPVDIFIMIMIINILWVYIKLLHNV